MFFSSHFKIENISYSLLDSCYYFYQKPNKYQYHGSTNKYKYHVTSNTCEKTTNQCHVTSNTCEKTTKINVM